MIAVRTVETPAERKRFIRVAPDLQKNDPAYVAPLDMERGEALSAKHNPFFAHADVRFFIAERDGRAVGRISAQADRRLAGTGHFGLLAAENDPAVASALFEAAEGWLRQKGATTIQGPFDLSINEEIGVLVEGFDTPPMLLMPHNPRYLPALVEGAGYAKVKDVHAYLFDARKGAPRWSERLVGRQLPKNVVLRPLDWKRYEEDLSAVVSIFNDAWSDNWNFMPLDRADLDALAKSMKPLIKEDLVQIAEVDGEPAAFGVCLPNLNEATRDLHGRLAPFGWAKLLWRLKVKGVATARVPLMGSSKRYARTPLGALLPMLVMDKIGRESLRLGMPLIEMSWILEDNAAMRHFCETMAGAPYKTYRVYEKTLAP